MDNVNVLRVGFMAPDFLLPDVRGEMFSLRDNLKDKFTALCFFPPDPSEKIKSYLTDIDKGLPATQSGLPTEAVAVCPDKQYRLERLQAEMGLSLRLLSDARLVAAKSYYLVETASYRPSVYFSVFVVDDEGIIRHRVSEVPGSHLFDGGKLRTEISKLI